MARVLVFSVLILLLSSAQISGESPQFGRETFPVNEKTLKCKNFTFPSSFSSDDVHVHMTVQNQSPKNNVYEAAVGWVEGVTQTQFTGCVVTAGKGFSYRKLSADWLAFQGTPSGSQTGRMAVPIFTTGSVCVDTYFSTEFDSNPVVHVTAVHENRRNKHDATSVWVEDISTKKFKTCFREIKNFNGIHRNLFVDWIAMKTLPSTWTNEAPESKALYMPNTGSPPAKFNYGFCQNVSFDEPFYKPPCVITTASHQYNQLDLLSIPPSENTITEWTEGVSVNGFSICVKDIQALEDRHAPVTIQFIALGQLHPCAKITCPFYASCNAKNANEYECICDFTCPSFEDFICSAQGITYSNECEYKRAICMNEKHVGLAHPGSCKPFVSQRGFAALDMSSDELKCSDITYNSSDFYSLQPVHVFLSINHGGQTNGLVHDAVNTWVEDVGEGKFTACAMKSGRLEHDGPLPSDYGLASVDWVAFQGAPRGGMVGTEPIDDWWEGTTCKLVMLPLGRFSAIPSVLLAAKHVALKRKKDSATLWTEDITRTSFQICIRELQNFDGFHRNISVSWMAYEYLPRQTFAEFDNIYFANGKSPKNSDNHAFCKEVTFKVNYMKKPAVMISATHNSSSGLLPDFNSITSWIENIDNERFKVCMKELHLKSVYDPVVITWVTIPECNSPLGVGMSDKRRITGDQLTASSQISSMYEARLGRLNNRAFPGVHMGAWCPLNNTGQWLQIDLGHLHVVTGVATQGRNSTLEHMWVETFELAFSKDGKTWDTYKENNITKVFNGNRESNMVVVNIVKETLLTRYVRFLPISWYGHVCMRVEVYGCEGYTEPIHVRMMSAGYNDIPSSPGGDSSITIDGLEVSPNERGHNVVAVDQEGSVIEARNFDTHGDSSAGRNMANFIDSLPTHTVALIAVKDSGGSFVDDAANALKSLGATEPLNPGYRGSWLLVGYKGTGEKPSWIRQEEQAQFFGPSFITVRVFE